MKMKGLLGVISILFISLAACSVQPAAKDSGASSTATSTAASSSSAGSAAPVITNATTAIQGIPDIKVELPPSLTATSLKLKARWNVTNFTDFSLLPGVKSEAWYRLVGEAKGDSPTLSILKALKFLANSTNITTNTAMRMVDVSDFMMGMTLGNNILYVETPAFNQYQIWWKSSSAAVFGQGGTLTPFNIQCYVEINAADSNRIQVNMFTTLFTNGLIMGYTRGQYNGSNGMVYDVNKGMGGPGAFEFKESYSSNGSIYMISTSVHPNYQTGKLSTNYNIAYGDSSVGGIVDIGGWNDDGTFSLNREAYDSSGSIIYKGWGNERVPDWAFSWATNNGVNLKTFGVSSGSLPSKFYITRKGYNIFYNVFTNNRQPYEGTYVNTNLTFNWTNDWNSGWDWGNTNYDEVSYSLDGSTWTAVTDPQMISNLAHSWGVYFMNDPAQIASGDSTYIWSAVGSGNGWTNIIGTNILTAPYWTTNIQTNIFFGWNGTAYADITNYNTNTIQTAVYKVMNTNVWSNVQVFERDFVVPNPESVLGKNFYVQNSFPLKYLALDEAVSNYSVRRMERETYTNIWTNDMGTVTNVMTNEYVSYDWWLSHPMWTNQTVFTNFTTWTNYFGYISTNAETEIRTNDWISTNYWYYPNKIETNTSIWTNNWTNYNYWIYTNTNINSWENGSGLREGNTNNIRLNNLRDENVYIWYNDGTMEKQSAKFAFSSSMKPMYFKMDSSKQALLDQVKTEIEKIFANNGLLYNIDLDNIWTNANMGNFPGKWAEISNRFDLMQ